MAKDRARVVTEGGAAAARLGLGEMPLTLWLLVAAVILYLYIRRASLGIDTHPGEHAEAPVRAPLPRVDVRGTLPFTLPPVPGTPGGPRIITVPDQAPRGSILQ